MKNFLNKHKALLGSVCFTILIVVLFNFLFSPYFETNDDLGMSNIIYGYSTQSLNIYLVYINVIVGIILKGLLSIWPNYPWYSILQYVLISVSFCVFVYLIIKKFGLKKGLFFSLFITLFLGYGTFITIQFTRTAAISTLSGVLLLFDAIEDEKKSKCKYLLSFILILFGSFYRITSFMMILIMMGFIGMKVFVRRLWKKDFKGLVSLCLPFIIIFSLCLAGRLLNNYAYQRDPVLKEYKIINKYRANVMDYSLIPYEEEPEFYESIGMNQDAYNVSRSWLFTDPAVFDAETFKALSENMSKKYQSTMTVNEILLGAKDLIYLCRYIFFPSVILGLVAFVYCFNKNKKNIPFMILEVIAFVGIELYLFYRGRYMISRVQYGLFFELLMIILIYGIDEFSMQKHKIVRLLLIVCVTAIGLYGNYLNDYKADKKQIKHNKASYIVSLEEADTHHKYINYSLGDRLFDVFNKKDIGVDSHILIFSGWRYCHSSYFENLGLNGYTNTYKDMVDDEDAIFTTTSKVDNITNYIRSYYYQDVRAILTKQVNNVKMYKFVTKNLDLSDTETVDGSDILNYSLTLNNTSLTGYCFIEGESSFAGEIYIGVVDARGNEHYYYTMQKENADYTEDSNGLYSSYFTRFDCSVSSINVYYKINSTIYKVEGVQYE